MIFLFMLEVEELEVWKMVTNQKRRWCHDLKLEKKTGFEWFHPKIGGLPPKWMVKIMVPNPMKKWMIWGVKTPIFGSTPIL